MCETPLFEEGHGPLDFFSWGCVAAPSDPRASGCARARGECRRPLAFSRKVPARPSAAFADAACCSTTASELLPSATRVSQSTWMTPLMAPFQSGAPQAWRLAPHHKKPQPENTRPAAAVGTALSPRLGLFLFSPALSLHPLCTRHSRVSCGASLTNHPLCPVSPQGTAADG